MFRSTARVRTRVGSPFCIINYLWKVPFVLFNKSFSGVLWLMHELAPKTFWLIVDEYSGVRTPTHPHALAIFPFFFPFIVSAIVLPSNFIYKLIWTYAWLFQRLFGTESTSFNVTSILVNPISTWVVVSGPRGLSVLRLPRRSGPQALFQGGRDTVFCR